MPPTPPTGPGHHNVGPVLPGFGNPPHLGVNPPIIGTPDPNAGGSDWQHLLIRSAEFLIGALLVVVGVNAMIIRSKPGQTVIQTAGTVARVAAK